MANDCDISATQAAFVAAIAEESAAAAAAELAQRAEAAPLLALLNGYPGATVTQGADTLPVLADIVQRVSAGHLGTGIAEWRYWQQSSPGAAVLTLPAAVSLGTVELNGARLAPGTDYTLSGATLTLTHALEPGDLLTLRSYGAAP